jgi:transcriptional repressor NrdR
VICPECHHGKSEVVDTRTSGDGIRRRRQCLECAHRFTTFERIERRLPLVVKKDGRRESYDRDKVVSGLRMACRKRPVSAEAIERAADEIEVAAANLGNEVDSAQLGALVLARLRDLDLVGYLRFASVYQEVQSPREFLELLAPFTGAGQREPSGEGSGA